MLCLLAKIIAFTKQADMFYNSGTIVQGKTKLHMEVSPAKIHNTSLIYHSSSGQIILQYIYIIYQDKNGQHSQK